MNVKAKGLDREAKRNPTACEHCRAARTKCQPSEQPGVCKKCLALKRECIARTRPRPRRWERKWGVEESNPSPQSFGQLSDFSIDYSVPVQSDLDDNFETLREMHEQTFDSVLVDEDLFDGSQTPSQTISLSSPSTTSNQAHSITDIWRQPLFNRASAEALLVTFNSLADYLPFVTLPEDVSVSQLAATKPFILLSILTVTSGSRAVQKHALYDDEFRKALGLKYVSGGERSLELLQGILIYCAWYPFHLRPKSGRLVHFLRIAADIVQDLRLDEDFRTLSGSWDQEATDDELDKIRAYLAFVYLVSTYIVVWKGGKSLSTRVPEWANTAIDTLQHNARVDGDNILAALTRLSLLFANAAQAINDRGLQTVQNSRLILVGLEQQYQQVMGSIPAAVADNEAIRLQAMFVDIFLDCGSIIALPVAQTSLSAKVTPFPPPVAKICSATTKLRALLDYVIGMDDSAFLNFTINDWTRFIVVMTLSFRFSFPLSQCPEFDSAWARSQLQLDQFLDKVSQGGNIDLSSVARSNDILSADRAVLGVMKTKYERRLASLGAPPPAAGLSGIFGCPIMMSGNLRASLEQLDPELISMHHQYLSESSNGIEEPNSLPLFHDVWATMTMGWGEAGNMSWNATAGSF